MTSEMKFKDTRLLEALDYLDLEYIDDVIDILKLPPANPSPERDRKTTLLSVKLVIALAASLLLLSACIPAISFVIRHYLVSPGGTVSSDTEETTAYESGIVTEPEETTSPEPADYSDIENLPELYRKVLKNEMRFHMKYYGEKKELLLLEASLSYTSQSTSLYYTAIDMDGDGAIEVAVKNNHMNTDTVVLHIEGDRVYGFYFYMSELEEIQDDGNFIWSNYSGTMITGFSRLTFPGGYEHEAVEICSKHSKIGEVIYYVSGKEATGEEYDAVYDTLSKTEIKWYPLEKYFPEETTETAPATSGDFEYRVREDGTLTVFYKGEAEEVTVPAEIDGKTVTAIGDSAFWLNRVKKVTLPDTITLIDQYAFLESGVEEINLPASLREIGTCAFQECHSLVNIELNEGLRVIGSYAFMNISAERIEIPASVESIGGGAFASCWQLRELILDPENKVYVASGNCIIEKSTKTLVIGFGECVIPSDGSVTSIGEGALGGTPITSLVIPDSVTSIGAWAFMYCSQLKSISVPVTVQNVGEGAFYECKFLESIFLPYGIKSIGNATFCGCINLKTADIPYGIEYIGEFAFSNCVSLTEIYIPESVNSIGRNAFEFCAGLTAITVPNSVKVIPDNTFYGCLKLERAQIGFGTTSIGAYAFGKCPILKEFVFTGSASKWYEVATDKSWNYSSGFTSVQCNDGIVPLLSEQMDNGTPGLQYMMNPDGKSASLVSVGDCTATEITVASSYNGYPVTVIGDNVFHNKTDLTSVQIPDTVTEIGYAAFNYCTSLTSIKLPESVTSIGSYAFSMCTSLTEIELPAGISYIGRDAFTSCPIREISLGDALETVEAEVFMNCTKLESITLPRSVKSIDLRAFKSCTSLESFNYMGTVAEWKAINRDKTWKEYCSFRYVHCSDGDIEADIMTADEAKQLAADYLGIIIGAKDPETGYKMVFWVKKEPTAASRRYVIAVSHEVSGDYYPIVKEVYVDIYSGECGIVSYDLADIPENFRAVIKNEKTFINGNMGEMYFKDSDSLTLYRPAQYGNIDYTVLDLDDDGKPELILEGMDGNLILHDTGKEIRGYDVGFRNMLDLKTDGTFDWTDLTISGEYGISRITEFTETGYRSEDLCHIHQDDDGNVTYYVGGKEVTKNQYDAFVATLSSDEVEWRDLDYYPTEMNVPM